MKPDMQTLDSTIAPPTATLLRAESYWTADQLRVMRGLELPTWFRPVTHDAVQAAPISCAVIEELPKQIPPLSPPPASPPPTIALADAVTPHASAIPLNLVQQHYPWLVIASETLDDNTEKLWSNMLASVGKTSQDVYMLTLPADACVANDPFSDVAQVVLAHIQAQLGVMQPKLIIAMGVLSAQILLAVEGDLAVMQGELHEFEGLPLLVMQHPAELLKTPALKAQVWRDLNMI